MENFQPHVLLVPDPNGTPEDDFLISIYFKTPNGLTYYVASDLTTDTAPSPGDMIRVIGIYAHETNDTGRMQITDFYHSGWVPIRKQQAESQVEVFVYQGDSSIDSGTRLAQYIDAEDLTKNGDGSLQPHLYMQQNGSKHTLCAFVYDSGSLAVNYGLSITRNGSSSEFDAIYKLTITEDNNAGNNPAIESRDILLDVGERVLVEAFEDGESKGKGIIREEDSDPKPAL